MANLKSAKKYHFIYRTTNLINGMYYIGMHSTNKLDDGYIGSGKRLWYSIHKYGIENFKCTIVEFLPDRDSLIAREKALVNEETLSDAKCLNLMKGGTGGFISAEQQHRRASAGGKAFADRLKTDAKLLEEYRQRGYARAKHLHESGRVKNDNFKGKSHSEETKQKMRVVKKGKGTGSTNSQFGTCWITNGNENKKIKKDELLVFLQLGWSLGRVI